MYSGRWSAIRALACFVWRYITITPVGLLHLERLLEKALETFKTHWPNHLSITSFYEAYWAQLLTFQLLPRVWVSFLLNPDTLRLS